MVGADFTTELENTVTKRNIDSFMIKNELRPGSGGQCFNFNTWEAESG